MLPTQYTWLNKLVLPSLVAEGLKHLGVTEKEGPANNPLLLEWAKEVDLENVYTADSIAWCGLYVALVAKRAGWPIVEGPLWAKNWSKFGLKADVPSLGDILVFTRPGGGGHVGFYIAEDQTAYHVLGGNQGDTVSIVRIAKPRMIAARRPRWRRAQPPSVKPYGVISSGALSRNEA